VDEDLGGERLLDAHLVFSGDLRVLFIIKEILVEEVRVPVGRELFGAFLAGDRGDTTQRLLLPPKLISRSFSLEREGFQLALLFLVQAFLALPLALIHHHLPLNFDIGGCEVEDLLVGVLAGGRLDHA